jgi:hypothetical protein
MLQQMLVFKAPKGCKLCQDNHLAHPAMCMNTSPAASVSAFAAVTASCILSMHKSCSYSSG